MFRPYPIEVGDLVGTAVAERRVLMLENPPMSGQARTTDSFYAFIQILVPGKTAPPHSSLGCAIPAAFAAELEKQWAELTPPVVSSALMREITGRSLAAAG